ncbi:MAG: hypothetical protein ACYDB5_10515 [bacterium]
MKHKINKQKFSESNKIKQPETEKVKINYDKEKPVFSCIFLDKDYSIEKCTDEEKLSFLRTIHILSQLTWEVLKQNNRHSLGYEKIAEVNCSLPPQITDDVKLIAFRFYNKAPMVGFRENQIFHIIFFDRNYKLYNH